MGPSRSHMTALLQGSLGNVVSFLNKRAQLKINPRGSGRVDIGGKTVCYIGKSRKLECSRQWNKACAEASA